MKKFRRSLGGETVDRMDTGQMVLAFGMSTDVMSRNVNPRLDKEMEETFKTITNALEIMEVTINSGWLTTVKLNPTDRQAIELQIKKYALQTGRAKLTVQEAKDLW